VNRRRTCTQPNTDLPGLLCQKTLPTEELKLTLERNALEVALMAFSSVDIPLKWEIRSVVPFKSAKHRSDWLSDEKGRNEELAFGSARTTYMMEASGAS
jgi:hypothetical protein